MATVCRCRRVDSGVPASLFILDPIFCVRCMCFVAIVVFVVLAAGGVIESHDPQGMMALGSDMGVLGVVMYADICRSGNLAVQLSGLQYHDINP